MSNVSRIPRLVPFLVMALALCAGGVCAKEKGKEKDKKFDFARTKAFICEMETRPDFPVSMVLANDYTVSLLATGNKIEPARENLLIGYIKVCQQKNGGFIGDKANKDASLLFTDFALETLVQLNATNAVDPQQVKSFVASLKNADGGFGFSQKAKGSTLATTYMALRVLKTIGALDLVDKPKTAAYLKGFERKEGGFGYVKGVGIANAKNTYMAAFALDSIGALDPATARGAVKFLSTTPYVKGKSSKRPELDEELYAVKALKLLKASDKLDKKFALTFLKHIYIEINGGFGPMEGYGSTPDSTATALRVLSEIGMLKPSNGKAAKKS
jgi:prenyltransferase beta subunit